MSTAFEIIRLAESPQPDPVAIGEALETFALTMELRTLEAIQFVSRALDRLPIPDELRSSAEWGAVRNDPILSDSENRISEIRTRLAEFSAN